MPAVFAILWTRAKTGVCSDARGHHVSFSGSANEPAGGLPDCDQADFEHLDVFRSWQDPEGRVQAAIDPVGRVRRVPLPPRFSANAWRAVTRRRACTGGLRCANPTYALLGYASRLEALL